MAPLRRFVLCAATAFLLMPGCATSEDFRIDFGHHPDGRRFVQKIGHSWEEKGRLKVLNNFVYVTFDKAFVVTEKNPVLDSLSTDHIYLVGQTADHERIAFLVGQTEADRSAADTFMASRSYMMVDKKRFARAVVGGKTLDSLSEVKKYLGNGRTYRIWITSLENLAGDWEGDAHNLHLRSKGMQYRKDLTEEVQGLSIQEERTFHPVD